MLALLHGGAMIAVDRWNARADKSVERYCIASILLGQPVETDMRFDTIVQSGEHERDRSRHMLKLALNTKRN